MGIKNKNLENMLWLWEMAISAVAREEVSGKRKEAFRFLYEEIVKIDPDKEDLWQVFLMATNKPPTGIII